MAANVYFVSRRELLSYSRYPGLVVSVGLLLNHIAFVYTGLEWFGVTMKIIASAWSLFMLVYVFGPSVKRGPEGQR